MGLMRFTVVDERSTVSFIGPDRALHALVAACASGADSIEQLLDLAPVRLAMLHPLVDLGVGG